MGAVQKLATIVIVGLVALATLLVIYLADEDNRREARAEAQQEDSIERGTETFIQFCLVCHGPAGEGYAFAEPGRVGAPIGGQSQATWINQTDDPVLRAEREELIRETILNGRRAPNGTILMPAWEDELNTEQVNELVLMIQNVDWNIVYNEALDTNGGYPTAPAAVELIPLVAEESATPAETGEVETGTVTLEAYDIGWRYSGQDTAGGELTMTVAPGTVIELVNTGNAHNFEAADLGINQDMPAGETVQVTVPENAEPGSYAFICNIPGHAAAGMVGTLIIEAP